MVSTLAFNRTDLWIESFWLQFCVITFGEFIDNLFVEKLKSLSLAFSNPLFSQTLLPKLSKNNLKISVICHYPLAVGFVAIMIEMIVMKLDLANHLRFSPENTHNFRKCYLRMIEAQIFMEVQPSSNKR